MEGCVEREARSSGRAVEAYSWTVLLRLSAPLLLYPSTEESGRLAVGCGGTLALEEVRRVG